MNSKIQIQFSFSDGSSIDYDYNNIVINEDGTVSDECKITKMYISANEISRGIVNASKEYLINNNKVVNKLKRIKVNKCGGAVPRIFIMNNVNK